MKKLILVALSMAATSLFAWTRLDLPNGGFEESAKGWTLTDKMCHVTPEAARTGKCGLRIQDEEPLLKCEAHSIRIAIEPEKEYAVRFWTRSKVDRAGTYLHISYFSESGLPLGKSKERKQNVYFLSGTRQWKENIFMTSSPKDARYAELRFSTSSSKFGRIEIDDIEIMELNKNEGKAMKTTEQAPKDNSKDYPELVQERIQELEAMLPEKPTGVSFPHTNRQLWDKLAKTPDGKRMHNSAMAILKHKYPELPDELYLQFSQNGNRSNYEKEYEKCTKWLCKLTLAECLEDKGRFMPKIEEFLDHLLSQKSWVLPAHDRNLSNFNNVELYPDLVGSDVTAMIAYIDWFLQDKLKPETRRRIRHEAYRRTFTPYQNVIRTGKITNGMWWITSLHNWNPVCTSNIVCASLILMESRHDRAEVLAAMETSNRFFYRGFTQDGYCDEGLGYWSYGFGHYLIMSEIVLASTNGKLDIFNDDPIVRKCCEFPRNIIIE